MRRAAQVLGCAVVAALLVATLAHSAATPPAGRATPVMFAGRQPSAQPPPSSHRSVTASALRPGPWTVVGLGDSVVTGNHCGCAPFINRYGDLVARATQRKTSVRNLGVSGSTSSDLIAALRPGGAEAKHIRGAAIVTVTIGANDMSSARAEWRRDGCSACFATVADSVEANVVKVLDLIRADAGGASLEVLVTTYWNVFEETPADARDAVGTAYAAMAALATLRANAAICAAADQRQAACIDLSQPFERGGVTHAIRLLAADRDHPNSRGHQLIASTLAAHGWAELREPVDSGP